MDDVGSYNGVKNDSCHCPEPLKFGWIKSGKPQHCPAKDDKNRSVWPAIACAVRRRRRAPAARRSDTCIRGCSRLSGCGVHIHESHAHEAGHGVLRVLSAQRPGDGEDPLGVDPAAGAAGTAFRVGHLRRGRLDARAYSQRGDAHPARDVAHARAAPHVRRCAARRDPRHRARYRDAGVRHIVALRGDAPAGQAGYTPHLTVTRMRRTWCAA